jgi:hypothetical protein
MLVKQEDFAPAHTNASRRSDGTMHNTKDEQGVIAIVADTRGNLCPAGCSLQSSLQGLRKLSDGVCIDSTTCALDDIAIRCAPEAMPAVPHQTDSMSTSVW